MKKLVSFVLIVSIFAISVPFASAQTQFEVNSLVSNGKKSKEVDSKLVFEESSFKATGKKTGDVIKQFGYADIQSADYSYSKKPLLSTGGAVAMAILTGLLVLPFLFVKKKQHWLSVRGKDDYIVMRLDKDNYMQIINEFKIHKVDVKTVEEKDEKGK